MSEQNTAKHSSLLWVVAAAALIGLGIGFWGGLENLYFRWSQREEYSHGFFIPLLSLWMLWDRREALLASIGAPSLSGLFTLACSLALLIVGELSAIFILLHGGFVLALMGLVLATGGMSLLRVAFIPLFFLLFAIPTPYFIDAQLSWGLQLISSEIGVALLRLFQISVYLEGNVIDLGLYQLQVVEACSGLRYLYPLLSLGFLAAYMFVAPLWQRALVFFSVIPITIFMNSFRIAVIGVLVNAYGTSMAEGFLHFFEGWVIFMGCAALLLFEIWLIDRLGQRRPIADLLQLPLIAPVAPSRRATGVPVATILAAILASGGAAGVAVLGERVEDIPEREPFSRFPLALGDWWGRESFLEQNVETFLDVSDYLLVDYRGPKNEQVNFYVAYYESQRKGSSPHSPRVCIPGGGWLITDLSTVDLGIESAPYPVVRTELELKGSRLLVYYWFKQRHRILANEYVMKWYLLLDSLMLNRTDGALVRVTTSLAPGEPMADADARIRAFIETARPVISQYVPD